MDTTPDELRRRLLARLLADDGKLLDTLRERLESDATVHQGEVPAQDAQ